VRGCVEYVHQFGLETRVIAVDAVPPEHHIGGADFVQADIRQPTIARVFDRVCDLLSERGYLVGDQVTPAGEIVWNYLNPVRAQRSDGQTVMPIVSWAQRIDPAALQGEFALPVTITPALPAVTSFAELDMPDALLSTLTGLGMNEPFPIQAATIPDALAGRDILGRGGERGKEGVNGERKMVGVDGGWVKVKDKGE